MKVPNKLPDYGAVATTEEGEPDRSFDADNAYYLKDSSSNTRLSPQQRFRKLIVVAVPIVLAIFIIGGAAFLILRTVYPSGHGGETAHRTGGRPTIVHSVHDDDEVEPSVPAPSSPKHGPPSNTETTDAKKSSGDAACSAHPRCYSSGLIGDCCPSGDGVMLDCCN